MIKPKLYLHEKCQRQETCIQRICQRLPWSVPTQHSGNKLFKGVFSLIASMVEETVSQAIGKWFSDTVRKMEKCSRGLSVRSDNEHILLYHSTAGNYEYDMADHNHTGLTCGLTNSMLFTAKQIWEILYAKLRETQIYQKINFFCWASYCSYCIRCVNFFLNISSLFIKEKKPSQFPTERQN